MSKSSRLSQGMAEWMSEQEPAPRGPRGQARVQFLPLAPDIQGLLEEGYNQRSIWKFLKQTGKFAFSFSAFSRLCGQYQQAQQARNQPPSKPSTHVPYAPLPKPGPRTQADLPAAASLKSVPTPSYPAPRRFQFDSVPNDALLALAEEDELSGDHSISNESKV